MEFLPYIHLAFILHVISTTQKKFTQHFIVYTTTRLIAKTDQHLSPLRSPLRSPLPQPIRNSSNGHIAFHSRRTLENSLGSSPRRLLLNPQREINEPPLGVARRHVDVLRNLEKTAHLGGIGQTYEKLEIVISCRRHTRCQPDTRRAVTHRPTHAIRAQGANDGRAPASPNFDTYSEKWIICSIRATACIPCSSKHSHSVKGGAGFMNLTSSLNLGMSRIKCETQIVFEYVQSAPTKLVAVICCSDLNCVFVFDAHWSRRLLGG